MNSKLFSSALFAGIAAGLIAVLLQFWLVTPLLLEGEEYETGAKTHYAGVQEIQDGEVHDHETHDHGDEAIEGEEEPENMLLRHAKTVAMNVVTFTGFGLVVVAGFAIASNFGHALSFHKGMIWGLLGFVALQLIPAAGLTPELPGTPAADVVARQYWWFGTVVASVVAVALIAFGRSPVFFAIAALLLAIPQIIGAPELPYYVGIAPPELSALFVSRTLLVAMIAWVVLGGVAGYVWNKSETES